MSTEENRGIYSIPVENLPKFEKQIAKLSKKAEKLTGESIYFVPFGHSEYKHANGTVTKCVDILFNGFEAPKLNGWKFLARIDHANEVGNIVRAVPGESVPDYYRGTPAQCEHCKINRYRRDTYLVENEGSGEIKQIGRTCLKDFTGHQHPEKVAKLAELLGYADEYARGAQQVGEDRRYLDLEIYMANVAAMISKYGYMSNAKAREYDKESTAAHALRNMFPEYYEEATPLNPDNFELANEAIMWAQALGEDGRELSEYHHNIKVIAASGTLEFRSSGYAASIIGSYLREKELFAKREQLISNHVGNVKDKITALVFFLGFTSSENQYGTSYFYRFADEVGNMFTWSTAIALECNKGDKLHLAGVVKEHTEYKGIKQTKLTHCKIKVAE